MSQHLAAQYRVGGDRSDQRVGVDSDRCDLTTRPALHHGNGPEDRARELPTLPGAGIKLKDRADRELVAVHGPVELDADRWHCLDVTWSGSRSMMVDLLCDPFPSGSPPAAVNTEGS